MTSYASVDDLRQYLPQVSELGQQQITVEGAPTGGTFTLSYEGVASAALAYNATATAVQTALRALTAIGSSGVNVRGRPGGPYTASFQGSLATDAGPLSLGTNGLTGGTSPTVTIAPATDAVLQDCLDRSTDTVRSTMRSLLADPLFDYAAYGAAAARIVRGIDSTYLRPPAYQLGSVTIVAYQSGTNPSAYTALASTEWEESGDGRLYRASGWWTGADTRYQITAVYGYGPTPPDSIVEVTLELAVNIWRTRDRGGFVDTVGVDGSGATKHIAGLTNLQQQILIAQRDQLTQIGV